MKNPIIRLVFVVPLLLACAVLSPSTLPTPTLPPAATVPAGPTITQPAAPTDLPADPTQPPPEPTAVLPALRVLVRADDGSVQFVDTGFSLADPALLTQGLQPRGGAAGDVVYALYFGDQLRIERIDALASEALDFGQQPNYALAVWPGNASEPAKLAFGTSPSLENGQTQLFIAAADGSSTVPVVSETIAEGAMPYHLLAQRWSADGQSLYFSREPWGIGGYIPFDGASSLFRYDLASQSVTELLPFEPAANALCLGDLNLAAQRAAGNCTDRLTITVYDLGGSGATTTIAAPAEVTGYNLVGSAHFSPDAARVAFALARGDPAAEQGWVAVSDGLSGASRLAVTADPGSYFTIAGWLDNDTLLLQRQTMNCESVCPASLWTVRADGSGLAHLTDGLFVAFVAGP